MKINTIIGPLYLVASTLGLLAIYWKEVCKIPYGETRSYKEISS